MLNISIGFFKRGAISFGVIVAFLIVAVPIIVKILYRQRVKMGLTIPDNEKRELPRDHLGTELGGSRSQTLQLSQSSMHLHAKNYATLRPEEFEFKELIQTKLPKIGLVTVVTVAYFMVEAYGCLQTEGLPKEGATYCYEFTGDLLSEMCNNRSTTGEGRKIATTTTSEGIELICEVDGGYGKCDDIIRNSSMFSFLFVVLATLQLYVEVRESESQIDRL